MIDIIDVSNGLRREDFEALQRILRFEENRIQAKLGRYSKLTYPEKVERLEEIHGLLARVKNEIEWMSTHPRLRPDRVRELMPRLVTALEQTTEYFRRLPPFPDRGVVIPAVLAECESVLMLVAAASEPV